MMSVIVVIKHFIPCVCFLSSVITKDSSTRARDTPLPRRARSFSFLPMMPRDRLLGASRHVVGVKAREPQRTGAEIRHHPHSPPVSKTMW